LAVIRPFRALRPAADKAKQVSCAPYDVLREDEVRDIIERNPLSFLRVTRAEGDLPEGSGASEKEIFERAKANLEQFISDGVLARDDEYALYVYQLSADGHTQTGVVACCSIDEYDQGLIKKHEHVRPDKVGDRTRHILAVGAQTGLIFLTFRDTADITDLISDAVDEEPLYSFDCPYGTTQKVWRITKVRPWLKAFARVPAIYIADGHHRAESAKVARDTLRDQNPDHNGGEDYNFVIAGMFPAGDLKILPYNRVVKDLNGMDKEDLFARLRESFIVVDTVEKVPQRPGKICMYIDGEWFKLRFNVQYVRAPDPIESLDVSILQNFVLGPVFGITDPRTNDRVAFVGGARGTEELERLVDEGSYRVAFSMYPTTMDDLLTISDMGETMPPKSTWFEPKLKDGLLVHVISE
jgi:uncharacterized protein (DUF1015 family)